MSDLKPCPCCGSESVIFEQYKKDGYRIECKNCALKREQRALCYSMDWLESKMKENWNNRPIEQEVASLKADKAELVDALESAMSIKSLWVPMGSFSDDPPENYQEMEALHLMARDFDSLLQKHKG